MVFQNGVNRLAIAAVLLALPAVAGTTRTAAKKTRHSTALHRTSAKTTHSKSTVASSKRRARGQQAIDPTRVREIQSALIREHYLDGEATGTWDARTKDAMTRFQADNGWQTKKLPDSRAIIKLGLGPDRADLINPDTAFVTPQPTAKGGGQQVPEPKQ